MKLETLFAPNEKPLDRIIDGGGFASIFRTVACVGDSLSSGEFESIDAEGNKHYHDLYEFSWGQYMGRAMGSKVYNFSKGGMTAKVYNETFADEKGFWNPDLAAHAYIFALGVNDILNQKWELGTPADIQEDWHENADTFAGHYGAIIQRYKEIQPDAKFFLMTMAKYADNNPKKPLVDRHAELLYQLADRFPNTYVLDIRQYGPLHEGEFREKFYLGGHLNPMGYILTAKLTMSYIDYIVRHHMEDFKQVGFIGTPYKY
ncbi:MAG: SGNH/GDSL hydrolase family protein [Clostridia bacterium]|nr:SGNH/GDSL hydrolase family protein [Clostridia bacterium]